MGGPHLPQGVLADLFNADRLNAVLEAQGWTLEEELRTLIGLARQDKNPKLKLAATGAIRRISTEVAKIDGRISEVSITKKDQDGTTVTARASTRAALERTQTHVRSQAPDAPSRDLSAASTFLPAADQARVEGTRPARAGGGTHQRVPEGPALDGAQPDRKIPGSGAGGPEPGP